MKLRTLCGIALFAYASSPLLAQEPRVYSEGAVSVVTTVNVHDGQLESYMGYLSKTFKPDMEAQKKAGKDEVHDEVMGKCALRYVASQLFGDAC